MGESSNERNRKVRTRVVTRRTVRLAVVDGRKGKLTERNQVRDHMVNYAVFGVEWSQPGPRPSGQAVMPKDGTIFKKKHRLGSVVELQHNL